MFRPFTLSYLAGCSASVFRLFGFWLLFVLLCSSFIEAKKVSPSVIVASIEGEVSSLNLEDEFKVQLGPTTVGKKINPKTILTTGKTGKVALLFSNGTLITIKPGSRFYLRTYKQLEGIVEGSLDPGKLEEEPTQSELSAHLDFGDLVVKAPKLKKGSSMKLTSPLGTAGIRGTMFQLMAVRNSVTGDIMGGINLISGDIDFTDTGGNMVSLLSGQSIQLATSKLGAPVASQTGELVDLASTYGPALTDGFAPPPLESVFVNYSELGSPATQGDTSSDTMFPPMPAIARTSISSVNSAQGWEMIHELATDLFFEIESAETVAAGFTFESMALAPTIDIPTPEPEAPVAPPSVTGETLAGADLEFFQGGHPELKLLGTNNSTDPLVKIFNNGARMQVEMRAPSEGITWRKIDPWVQALDFLGNDITPGVQLSGAPKILLANSNSAESEAPPPGSSVSYEVSYSIRDLRGLNTVIFRQVDVVATRPTIEIANKQPSFPWNELDLDGDGKFYDSFYTWVNNQVTVQDVRGEFLDYSENEKPGSFYLSGEFDLSKIGTFHGLKVVAIDWRGLRTESDPFTIQVTSPEKLPTLTTSEFVSNFPALENEKNLLEYGDPANELGAWLNGTTAVDVEGNPVDVTYKISGNEALSPLEIDNIFPGSGTRLSYTVVFEAVDPRWAADGSDPSMKAQLTRTETRTIEVVATPPKVQLVFHNPRNGLGVSQNQDEIRYLVESKDNVSDFPDDGPFAIAPDPGESNRLNGRLYYKATAYNGFGTDITDKVKISYDVDVNSRSLNESSTMTVSVNDQSIRGTSEWAETVLTPKIKIVDVIAPILSFPSGQTNPFVVEGIMPELALLNGSSKDQVSGNTDSEYYFNDPGLEIIDNYYTIDELHTHNGIDSSKSYTFEYTNVNDTSDPSGRIPFSPVFEYNQDRIQTNLDMAKMGDYTLTYSISDPSENSATLTRNIKVQDTQAPVVKLYGSKTMYVDLQAIESGETRFYDPGAFAVENLYKKENGFVDWLVEDEGMDWSFAVVKCNDLENDTYPVVDENDSVPVSFLDGYINGLVSNPPSEVERYRFYYFLTDYAGNIGSNFRTIELRGSDNLYPSIDFILVAANYDGALDGDPNDAGSTIDSINSIATLPSLTWTIEVGDEIYDEVPEARVYTELGGGQENLDNNYSVFLYHISSDGSEELDAENSLYAGGVSNFPNSGTFFSSVNYWVPPGKGPGESSFFSGNPGSYVEHARGTDGWRKVVFRYKVTNSLGNTSVRDMVVRLVDSTPPQMEKASFTGPVEIGEPFTDPGVTVTDLAGSDLEQNRTIHKDGVQYGNDVNATFDELRTRGFWESGIYTITYNAVDKFLNSTSDSLTFSVQDTKKPHVAIITHNHFSTFDSDQNFWTLEFNGNPSPSVDPVDKLSEVFSRGTNYGSDGGDISWSGFYDQGQDKFFSDSNGTYISENEDGTGFYLKASEVDVSSLTGSQVTSSSLPTQKLDDEYGRTYAWFSPFTINFVDSDAQFHDLGLLIYEPSNSNLTYSVTITPDYTPSSNDALPDQIREIILSVTVSQSNPSLTTEINPYRTYTFLDDLKPLITLGPYTDSNTTFIVVEAGSTYSDVNGVSYRILENGVIKNDPAPSLYLSAYDVSDDYITEDVQSTYTDLNDSLTGAVSTDYGHLNHIYRIEYNVDDEEGNSADPKYRYLIIKDTTPPVLSFSGTTEELILGYNLANDIDYVKSELLKNVTATDLSSTNQDAFVWEVNITKPDSDQDANRSFKWNPDPSATNGIIYPDDNTSAGYNVTITATDESGNTSLAFERTLKISDTIKPEITLIGESTIHDFLRYSKNTALDNNESLHADQPDSEKFDSSGFDGGAHRIILDDYSFVDPGAYAEDDNSFFSRYDGYPDKDGDQIGETWAFERVTDEADMENCAVEGVIYIFSALHSNSLSYYQAEMADNDLGSESTVSVPDVDGGGYDFNSSDKSNITKLNVTEITNKYRVRDGWGNKSDIAERRIYIYESSQYPNFAFYATPLNKEGGGKFEHLYDNGSDDPYLNSTRKDTDGDGVSDFWELALGTNPLDRGEKPDVGSFSNPEFFKGIDFNATNPP